MAAYDVLIHRLLEYENYHFLISYGLFNRMQLSTDRVFFFVRFEETGLQNYQQNSREAIMIEQVVGST